MLQPYYKQFFSTLSNETRLEILFTLQNGPMNVSELTDELGYGQSTISNNLRILKECSFVTVKPNGKERVYTLNAETIEPLLALVDEHTEKCCKHLIKEEQA